MAKCHHTLCLSHRLGDDTTTTTVPAYHYLDHSYHSSPNRFSRPDAGYVLVETFLRFTTCRLKVNFQIQISRCMGLVLTWLLPRCERPRQVPPQIYHHPLDGMRITVEITDLPVTAEIVDRLPWLKQLDRFRSDPKNPFTNTLPREISRLRE